MERLIADANKVFLSTPSEWRATAAVYAMLCLFFRISIHALRVEGDWRMRCIILKRHNFYPRLFKRRLKFSYCSTSS